MSKPEAAAAAGARGDATSADLAGEEIVRALGPLAASPLTEQAVTQMRRVLARAGSPAIRDALRRRRSAAGTDHRDVMPALAPAAAKVCRRTQAQPVTRLGVGGSAFVGAGAW